MAEKPRLLVVGGPNGSGKTTVALKYASTDSIEYIGADALAATLNRENPGQASMEAGRQFLRLLDAAIDTKRSCVVESTLSGRGLRRTLIDASDCGYEITIVFVYLDSAEACVARVAERVRKGGHHVPETDIRRRFGRSIRNFWSYYRELADAWVVLYNGGSRVQDVSLGSRYGWIVRDSSLHLGFMSLVEMSHD